MGQGRLSFAPYMAEKYIPAVDSGPVSARREEIENSANAAATVIGPPFFYGTVSAFRRESGA